MLLFSQLMVLYKPWPPLWDTHEFSAFYYHLFTFSPHVLFCISHCLSMDRPTFPPPLGSSLKTSLVTHILSIQITFSKILMITVPWGWVLIKKPSVAQPLKAFSVFYETQKTITCPQETSFGLCPELHESASHTWSYFSKNYFNFVLSPIYVSF
jgi:hypothetical protein